MKKPFHDPIAPKMRKCDKTFGAPTKEQATTGSFMPPGDNYGIGRCSPVGKFRASSIESGPIPMKSFCFDPNDVI